MECDYIYYIVYYTPSVGCLIVSKFVGLIMGSPVEIITIKIKNRFRNSAWDSKTDCLREILSITKFKKKKIKNEITIKRRVMHVSQLVNSIVIIVSL